ncbi:hypothetical protein M378DRAFT_162337 [Amanita muscaria Koide BX008]|uniref:Uncharacterized protein n=1 Tax=Amanita muscaria (strain Koide BX008) TaxID=946122 RepID=A0A0C2X727_AMAMK|nr:hypothetical protein M378DRAFT_162337 [Amanita muscaria Koide BX008]
MASRQEGSLNDSEQRKSRYARVLQKGAPESEHCCASQPNLRVVAYVNDFFATTVVRDSNGGDITTLP